MVLTELQIRNAKPGGKPYKPSDSGGLFLHVTPAGGKLWRVKFISPGRKSCCRLAAGLMWGWRRRERSETTPARHLRPAPTPLARNSLKSTVTEPAPPTALARSPRNISTSAAGRAWPKTPPPRTSITYPAWEPRLPAFPLPTSPHRTAHRAATDRGDRQL